LKYSFYGAGDRAAVREDKSVDFHASTSGEEAEGHIPRTWHTGLAGVDHLVDASIERCWSNLVLEVMLHERQDDDEAVLRDQRNRLRAISRGDDGGKISTSMEEVQTYSANRRDWC